MCPSSSIAAKSALSPAFWINLLRLWNPNYRPWELEKDLGIRAQLRVLDMKRERFGDKHRGARTTLGKLADMCRSAGRLEVERREGGGQSDGVNSPRQSSILVQ